MTMTMQEPITVAVTAGDSEMTFETGRLAKQASGAVWVRAGDTTVLATAVGQPEARPGADFFPLTVDIEERMYAAGKIPGGFFKREGRSGEKAILTARMIDRPIRPLWPKNFNHDVHCVVTAMSVDMVNAHDILAINGVSAALMISPLPFFGPVGAVRVGIIDGEIKINPSMPEMLESDLDLIVCGTTEAITMVEAGAEIVPEETIVEALELAHAAIKNICAAQKEFAERAGKPKWTSREIIEDFRGRYMSRIEDAIRSEGVDAAQATVLGTFVDDAAPAISLDSEEDAITQRLRARTTLNVLYNEARVALVREPIEAQFGERILEFSNYEQDSKELKAAKKDLLESEILGGLDLPFPGKGDNGEWSEFTRSTIKAAFAAAYKAVVRRKIAVDKRRPDGRGERDIRTITTDVSIAPRTHGSGLFTRGQTQVLSLCTLGTTKEEQRIDDLSLESNKYYIHHYNFPPFSVGETGFMRGPKRRDIGHGALAERALVPVIPDMESFPYTLRVVSETLESNGSSSMASVCGSTLALMDAGVPITAPVAGIAMGLIMEGDSYVILTDIQGAEDHLGDMDFKVAGTSEGISALQMDIKITGVTTELLRAALAQARDARLAILEIMRETIAEPRPEVSDNAPRIETVKIAPDQIGMVIGKGGETIRSLEEKYQVSISIEDTGLVQIYGVNKETTRLCAEEVEMMCREVAVGDEYEGPVVKITDFGAFIELKKGTDGLLHVSSIGPGRIESVESVLSVGDRLGVRVVSVDKMRGRIGLVMIRDKDGNEVAPIEPSQPAGGGNRGGDRPRGGGQGGNRGRGGQGGGGGGGNRNRSRGGQGGGGGSRPRSQGGGGDRPKNAGGQGNNNRNSNGGAAKNPAPRPEAPAKETAPADKDGSGIGRRFRMRLRGGDDD